MAIPRKGLSNIRTISGKVVQVAVPYRAYMQVTCLEMEKARRGAERRSAVARVTAIDARLAAIEKEKAALLAAIEHPEQGLRAGRGAAHRVPAPPKRAAGFRIRY